MSELVLSPFSKSLLVNSVGIMIIGEEKEEITVLIKSLNEIAERNARDVDIRRASCFPLDRLDSRPRIDMVVACINLDDKHSVNIAETALQYFDIRYFTGKLIFLVVLGKSPAANTDTREKVQAMANKYSSGVLFAKLKDGDEGNVIADRILRLADASKRGLNVLSISGISYEDI